jgi:hypothetical protein
VIGRRYTALIKKTLAGLGLVAASIILVLILVETGLRFTPYKNLLAFSRSHVPEGYYRPDPVMGYDIRENFPKTDIFLNDGVKYPIWSNEIGCFDAPYGGEKDFVLLVGDSFAHAFAPFQDKWGAGMESLLGMRVLKCGVSGFGTKQAALKADSTCARVRQTPRLIVVGYFMNDFIDDYLFPQYSVTDGYFYITKRLVDRTSGAIAEKVRTKPPKSLRIWLKQHSIGYNLYERAMMRFSPSGEERVIHVEAVDGRCSDPSTCEYPWLTKAWQAHIDNIRSFRALAHAPDSKVLFVLIPARGQIYPFLHGETDPLLDRKYAIVRKELEKAGLPSLDLLPLLRAYANTTPRKSLDPKTDLYWAMDGHWNIKGNHLAGLLVSEYILEKDLVHIPDRVERLASIREKLKGFPKAE